MQIRVLQQPEIRQQISQIRDHGFHRGHEKQQQIPTLWRLQVRHFSDDTSQLKSQGSQPINFVRHFLDQRAVVASAFGNRCANIARQGHPQVSGLIEQHLLHLSGLLIVEWV